MNKITSLAKYCFAIGLFTLLGLKTGQAQERVWVPVKPTAADSISVIISGPEYQTGSPYLTEEVKDRIRTFFGRATQKWGADAKISAKIAGVTNFQNWEEACRSSDGRWGENANWPFAVTSAASLAECGIQNELSLEEARGYGAKRFVVSSGLAPSFAVDTDPYGAVDTTETGPTRKTVAILVTRQRYVSVPAETADVSGFVTKPVQARRDARQDSLIAAMADRGADVSAHIGVGGETVAHQLATAVEFGVRINTLEINLLGGYWPNSGSVDLAEDGGMTEHDYLSYGGYLSWYVFRSGGFELGPHAGLEHTETVLEGEEKYVRAKEHYLLGISGNLRVYGPIELHLSASWAPVREYEADDLVADSDAANLRIGAALRANF